MSSQIKYRPEIDGLRALAVIAVIVFHLDPSWLKGGFLGVDVFFVISGFLITTIIQRKIEAGTFSFREFCMRRIHRLYPALTVMVAIVALVGNYVLIRPERTDLIQQSIAAILSFSNILLWKTTGGYWSHSSENIALLHTWSLSLEEQFYVVFPALLFLINRHFRRWLFPILALITVASLAASIVWTESDRSAAFYLLPSRLWELSIGSLLATAMIRFPSAFDRRWPGISLLPVAGLSMIVLSFFLFQNDENFPKATPLLACIGTGLVLASGHHEGAAKRVLTLTPVRYIGNISYSLYLWHWPVIVFARFLSPDPLYLELLAIMFVLAALSYHFVENPFRNGFRYRSIAAIGMPATVALSLIPLKLEKWNNNIPDNLGNLETYESRFRGWKHEATDDLLANGHGIIQRGEYGDPLIVVAGDSHSRVMSIPIADFAREAGFPVEILATSGVGISRMENSVHRDQSKEINRLRLARIEELQPEVVILCGKWIFEVDSERARSNFQTNLRRIAKASERVIVLSQPPVHELPHTHQMSYRKYLLALSRSGLSPTTKPSLGVVDTNQLIANLIHELDLDNVNYIDIYPEFISNDGTVRYISENKLLYSDYHHLNEYGAKFVFERSIRAILAATISGQHIDTKAVQQRAQTVHSGAKTATN